MVRLLRSVNLYRHITVTQSPQFTLGLAPGAVCSTGVDRCIKTHTRLYTPRILNADWEAVVLGGGESGWSQGPSWTSHTFRDIKRSHPLVLTGRAHSGSCRLKREPTTGISWAGEAAGPPPYQGPAGSSEHALYIPCC